MDIGANIRNLREERGLTQVKLAEKLKVMQQVITSYERGVTKPPIERLPEIARIFGITVDELLGVKERSAEQTEKPVHKSRRIIKVQELFEKLPVTEQRALLKLIKVYVTEKRP
jgi:transcriptional regulator with XRE-family HTH domain